MKYISITFDDGRSDNCLIAKPIMDKYRLRGTVYITTGFIDNTWVEKDVLESPTRPLTIDEIYDLYKSNWEIGLHGDKHKTQVDDMRNALNKLKSWKIDNSAWGISIPNSITSESDIVSLFDSDYGETLSYIRRGRKCDTSKLYYKLLFGLYSILKFKKAYRAFNKENYIRVRDLNKSNIPSVVVKSNDTPNMIIDYIKRIPDNSIVVLMLHSILPSDHPLCGKDPWSWENKKFDSLCSKLNELSIQGVAKIAPLVELLSALKEKE